MNSNSNYVKRRLMLLRWLAFLSLLEIVRCDTTAQLRQHMPDDQQGEAYTNTLSSANLYPRRLMAAKMNPNIFQGARGWSKSTMNKETRPRYGDPFEIKNMNLSRDTGKGIGGKGNGKGKGSKGMSNKSHKQKRDPSFSFPPFYPDECPPGVQHCISVMDLFLVDATTNERLLAIRPGDFLDLASLSSQFGTTDLSVECAANKNLVGSMILSDNFGARTIDKEPPFIISGDSSSEGYLKKIVQDNPAIWTIFCQPFYGEDGNKGAGPPRLTSVVIEAGDVTPPTTSPTTTPNNSNCTVCRSDCIDVVDFVLIDSTTDMPIRSITPGSTILVSPSSQYTVECITSPHASSVSPFSIGSVFLEDSYENLLGVVLNTPPFALTVDGSGQYGTTNFFDNPGTWEVACTAFCGVNAGGDSSVTRTISFNVNALGTISPGDGPTQNPTRTPTDVPTAVPTPMPTTSAQGTSIPTIEPTVASSVSSLPTMPPSKSSSPAPTKKHAITSAPTLSIIPTISPSVFPSGSPTLSSIRSNKPSANPTGTNSVSPSKSPSSSPTAFPSASPTLVLTGQPTMIPSTNLSEPPSQSPTLSPSLSPTLVPTSQPTTAFPTVSSMPSIDCTGSECKAGCLVVEGFDLVNSNDPLDRRRIVEGQTIQIAESDTFTIECIPRSTPFNIGSAIMSDNQQVSRVVENFSPYTLREAGSSLYELNGEWIVNCQMFCERRGEGESGESFTITFVTEQSDSVAAASSSLLSLLDM